MLQSLNVFSLIQQLYLWTNVHMEFQTRTTWPYITHFPKSCPFLDALMIRVSSNGFLSRSHCFRILSHLSPSSPPNTVHNINLSLSNFRLQSIVPMPIVDGFLFEVIPKRPVSPTIFRTCVVVSIYTNPPSKSNCAYLKQRKTLLSVLQSVDYFTGHCPRIRS